MQKLKKNIQGGSGCWERVNGGLFSKDNELSVELKDDYSAPTAITMLYNVIDARRKMAARAETAERNKIARANENKQAAASSCRRICLSRGTLGQELLDFGHPSMAMEKFFLSKSIKTPMVVTLVYGSI